MSYRLRVLQAEHGDAIIVTIPVGEELHHIVIDGGPSSKYAENIIKEIECLDVIDLMVLTHYDDDHIGGLIEYFKKHQYDALPIKKMWVNCASDVSFKSCSQINYSQARTLESFLISVSKKQDLPWKDTIVNSMDPVDLGYCKIQILSPSPESLRLNMEKYVKEEGIVTISSTCVRVREDVCIPLKDLAERPDNKHTAKEDLINKSSIAFILVVGDSKVLLMGDADPWIVFEKLKSMGYSKDNKLSIDYWKMSHHGSRNNISKELLEIINCNNFIFSTNGGYGSACHPDRETLAKILCQPDRNEDDHINLFFNYPLNDIQEKTLLLLSNDEKKQYRCDIYGGITDFTVV